MRRAALALTFVLAGCAGTEARLKTYDVTSDPTGCAVEVDGRRAGKTPCEIQLEYHVTWDINQFRGDTAVGDDHRVVCWPPADRADLEPKSRLVKPHRTEGERGSLHFVLRPKSSP